MTVFDDGPELAKLRGWYEPLIAESAALEALANSPHPEGSDAWYDDLEAWVRSQDIDATDENILLARERIMNRTGRFIPGDMRFFHQLERADLEASRKAP